MRYFILAIILISTKSIFGEILHRWLISSILILVYVFAASDTNQNELDLWKMAVNKRKLQLKGVYPIVVLQNGKMVRVYVNQKSPLPNNKPVKPVSGKSNKSQHGNQVKNHSAKEDVRRGKSIQYTDSSQTQSTQSRQSKQSTSSPLPLSTSFFVKPSSSTPKPTTKVKNRSIKMRKGLKAPLKKESYIKHVEATHQITTKPTNKLNTKSHMKRTTYNSDAISSSRVTSCIFELVIIIPVCQLICSALFYVRWRELLALCLKKMKSIRWDILDRKEKL